MSASANVIALTPNEGSTFEAFFKAEALADRAGRPLTDEIIEALNHERDQLSSAVRRAHDAYAAPFDPATMRRYVVLRYAIDLIERMAEHKGQVAPILFPELAPKRRRA